MKRVFILVIWVLVISCKAKLFDPTGNVNGKIIIYDEYGTFEGDYYRFNMVIDDGKKKWQASTQPDGTFEFKDIPRGTYKLSGSKEGYKPFVSSITISHVGGEVPTPTNFAFYQIAQTHVISSPTIEVIKKSNSDYDYEIKVKAIVNPLIPTGKNATFTLFGSLNPIVDTTSTYIMNVYDFYLDGKLSFGRTEVSKFLSENKVKKQNVYFAFYQNSLFATIFNQNSTKLTFPLLNTRGSNVVKVYIE